MDLRYRGRTFRKTLNDHCGIKNIGKKVAKLIRPVTVSVLSTLLLILTAIASIEGAVPNTIVMSSRAPDLSYIVTVLLENASLNSTYGSRCRGNCTYITNLANEYGLAENYSSIAWQVSLPNYLTLTSGGNYDTAPFDTNCYPQLAGCSVSSLNIIDSIESSGRTWKAYIEDYVGGGCSRTGDSNYTNTHNPFVYYTDIYNNTARCGRIVNANPGSSGYLALPAQLLSDLNSTATTSNYMWLTPNRCDDGHSLCPPVNNATSQQNQYLSMLVPRILNSTIFRTQQAAIFITWDESSIHTSGIVTAIWAGPTTRLAYKSMLTYSHYSAVRTVEIAWGLPALTSYDLAATPMTEFFEQSSSVGGEIVPVNKLLLLLPAFITGAIMFYATLAALAHYNKRSFRKERAGEGQHLSRMNLSREKYSIQPKRENMTLSAKQ